MSEVWAKPLWALKDYAALKEALIAIAEEEFRAFSDRIIPGAVGMLGVRTPLLRGIAREIAKGDWNSFFSMTDGACYELTILHGMVLGLMKADIETCLAQTAAFVPFISNWAICDVTVGGLKWAAKNRPLVWEFLKPCLESQAEYPARFGVVMLMSHFIVDGYIDDVLRLLCRAPYPQYYAQMAVAWALSVCYVKYPEKTRKALQNDAGLDAFTFNKALQKMCESYRVSPADKAMLRGMKRKG